MKSIETNTSKYNMNTFQKITGGKLLYSLMKDQDQISPEELKVNNYITKMNKYDNVKNIEEIIIK